MLSRDVLRIDVAGLPISGRPAGPHQPDGLYLGPEGFSGWTGGVAVRREVVQRALAAGDFDAPGFLDSRTASFSGTCVSPSAEATEQWGRRLTGTLAGGGAGRVAVQTSSGVQYATGRLAGQTEFDVRGRTPRIADWQMQLWFNDPRKFGEMQEFRGAAGVPVAAFHRGNFDASPLLTITGVMPGYSILGPRGAVYSVAAAVTAAAPHTIDLATGRLTVGGVPRYGFVPQADLWTVPAGVQVNHTLVPTSGAGQLVVGVRGTYI